MANTQPATASVERFGLRAAFKIPESLPSGLASFDKILNGFPRGAISEIAGPDSSGRATLANVLLASATRRKEVCAYVDTSDAFDPYSAAASGVVLSQMLWVRCGHHVENALKAADFLLHAGGFGVVVLDLTRADARALRRIPISYWHRFRLAVENTPTVLALLERDAQAKSCAGLIVELTRKNAVWSGAPGFLLLKEVEIEAGSRKPMRPGSAGFLARMPIQ